MEEEQRDGSPGSAWPFLGAVALIILNVDYVLYSAISPFVVSFWSLFFILSVFANIEIILWYKFWRWFFTVYLPERKKIRETIEFSRKMGKELKKKGYADQVKDFFEQQFEWAINPNQWLFRMVKTFGHFGLIFLGAEPFFAGGRLIGVVFCATAGSKKGLISLCIGNAAHVAITIWSWKAIYFTVGTLWDKFF